MINYVEKVWGSEEWLINNDTYCSKFLNLVKGFECSVHYHVKKDETFYVLEGEVDLYVVDLNEIIPVIFSVFEDEDEVIRYHQEYLDVKDEALSKLRKVTIKAGEQFRLKPFVAHKFTAKTDTAKILEVSTTHYDEDSYRLTTSGKL